MSLVREQKGSSSVTLSGTVVDGDPVGLVNGLGRRLQAGDTFWGFAEEAGVSGDVIKIVPPGQGERVVVTFTAVVANIGASLYANSTVFTLTSSSNSLVGTILSIDSATTVVVQF